ncbi:AAA family ATPase [Streptomyces sp. NPDC052721]|uniref:ATP-binding protein n=1 Tax=Streptomyces sp. NPDC052721 TaxID=3154955 RepID=UPI00341A5E11
MGRPWWLPVAERVLLVAVHYRSPHSSGGTVSNRLPPARINVASSEDKAWHPPRTGSYPTGCSRAAQGGRRIATTPDREHRSRPRMKGDPDSPWAGESGPVFAQHEERTRTDCAELIGRATELAMLNGVIEQVRGGSAASVLLRGGAGVGKTALLDAVAVNAQAKGFRVLRATGVESEVTLALSGLHQLLYSLKDEFDRLPYRQRDVLKRALGLSPGTAPEQFVISVAVLELLHGLADNGPLLLVVDDAQWIDEVSARIVAFVVRRLAPKPIGFLAAARSEWKTSIDRDSLEYSIEPLRAGPAAELLDSRFPGLAQAARRRLLDEAAGNPLALLELPALLSAEQLSGQAELPGWLTLSDRLESLYSDRVRSLPETTRDLLLLAAFETTGSIRTIWSALPEDAVADCAVVPAERAALVRMDTENGRLVFRHPLVRSAIVQLATPDRRRTAHRTLGAVLDHEPERQIGHLIAGSLGPDETVAQKLENAAHRAVRRGAATAAVSALRHASALSLQPQDRSRRLAMAAFAASHAGQLDAAAEVLDSGGYCEHASPEDAARAASALAFRLIHRDCDVRAAHRLLLQALDNILDEAGRLAPRAPTDDLTDELFFPLIEASCYGGTPELWEQVAERIGPASSFVRLSFDALSDPVRRGHTVTARLRRAFDDIPAETDPRRIMQMARSALFCDDLSRYRQHAARAADLARTGGAFASWAAATLLLALDAYHTGQWDEADTMLCECLEVAEEFDYALLGCRIRYQLAFIEAGRGRAKAVNTLTDKILAMCVPKGVVTGQVMAHQTRALLSLGAGDYETAYRHCVQISPPGEFPAYVSWALWSVLDLVEAAVMTGRTAEARDHVAAAQRADIQGLSPRIAFLVAGAAALAAPDDQAEALFEKALALPDADRYAFECARIRLSYGQRLFDRGKAEAAREQLRCALNVLELLGAQPWAVRARTAWEAAAVASVAVSGAGTTALTPRELQIADLAATGMSNKQIAAELFLSQRTVSTHLYNLFPKLGVRSRAALRDALRNYKKNGT